MFMCFKSFEEYFLLYLLDTIIYIYIYIYNYIYIILLCHCFVECMFRIILQERMGSKHSIVLVTYGNKEILNLEFVFFSPRSFSLKGLVCLCVCVCVCA